MDLIKPFAVYFAVISLIAVILCIYDKKQAKKGAWRCPEKTLFTVSILGGALAMYICMLKIRHKTRHKRFMIGLPVIIVLQAALLIYIFSFLC